jgi:hypothetical protein
MVISVSTSVNLSTSVNSLACNFKTPRLYVPENLVPHRNFEVIHACRESGKAVPQANFQRRSHFETRRAG